VLLDEGTIGDGNWVTRLEKKVCYGCNWRQQADDERRMGRDDGHEVA